MENKETPFTIGENWFIRTLTYHQVGKVVAIQGDFLILDSGSWVADSGRFAEALVGGTLSELEFVGKIIVNLGNIVDAFPWNHELPKETI